ncbi:MAG: hypothetical protein FJW32_19865 [Acidobacteria bacterium]|nr:hypothetical protein [Acidobacteriota bacterium]
MTYSAYNIFVPESEEILRSWKEIAAHLGRGVRTVQRWEQAEGLPVHRHEHLERSSVYAYQSEVDAWWQSRRLALEPAAAPIPRPRWPVFAAASGIAIAAAAYWLPGRTADLAPKFFQVTNDGRQKFTNFYNWSTPILSDGARIYFTAVVPGGYGIFRAGADGQGEPAQVPTPVPNPTLVHLSPDGAELLVAEFGYRERPLWIVPVSGAAPRRLANVSALDAAWSADKTRLVLTRDNEILIANADGSEPRRIAQVDGVPRWPRWSPSGDKIRFTLFHREHRNTSIHEIPASGGAIQKLPGAWNESGSACCGDWTAGGRHYVFESSRSGVSTIWALKERHGLLQTPSPDPIALTTGPMECRAAAPNPRGGILFVGIHRRRELVRHDAASKQFVLVSGAAGAEGGEYSRDGKWFAYRSYPDGILWRSRADGSDLLQLTQRTPRAAHPAWSPDGKSLATIVTRSRAVIIPANGGDIQYITGEDIKACFTSWSPDGKSIMFGACPFNPADKDPINPGIRIIDIATRAISTVPGSKGLQWPRWSPDGRYVLALGQDHSKLVLLDRQTGVWRDWVNYPVTWPLWSRKQPAAYFVKLTGADSSVMRIAVNGKEPVEVANLNSLRRTGEGGFWLGLTPNDEPMVLRDAGSQEIFSLQFAVQ